MRAQLSVGEPLELVQERSLVCRYSPSLEPEPYFPHIADGFSANLTLAVSRS